MVVKLCQLIVLRIVSPLIERLKNKREHYVLNYGYDSEDDLDNPKELGTGINLLEVGYPPTRPQSKS